MEFHNNDLQFELEKIKSFDAPITVAKAYEEELNNHYAIDVEDSSYWYAEQDDRDEDFEKLKSILPNFTFIEE
jgi:hypothetical protein